MPLAKYEFPKPCLGCNQLTREGSYCARCLEEKKTNPKYIERELAKAERKKLLYGGDYRRRRREILAISTHCALCGVAFRIEDRREADHIEPGNPNSLLQAVHRSCNIRKGGKRQGDY